MIMYLIVIPWARVVYLIYTPEAQRAAGLRAEGVYIKQTTSAHGITNIYQLANVWANQQNYSIIASLYLYGDLLDCIVGLNLMIKMFL